MGEARDEVLLQALERMGLLAAGARPRVAFLEGGGEVRRARVDLATGPLLVKAAAAGGAAARGVLQEAEFLRVAGEVAPDGVPELLGVDPEAAVVALRWLDPAEYPPWSSDLGEGRAEWDAAVDIAESLVAIHKETAGDAAIAERFGDTSLLEERQLEPHLRALARACPESAAALEEIATGISASRRALVHGSVDPETILIGRRAPVLVEAECACCSDPAWDLARCLHVLLTNAVCNRRWYASYLNCYEALAETYLDGIDWEPGEELDARASRILCALLLARVDGAAPLPGLHGSAAGSFIREHAAKLLAAPPDSVEEVRAYWRDAIAGSSS